MNTLYPTAKFSMLRGDFEWGEASDIVILALDGYEYDDEHYGREEIVASTIVAETPLINRHIGDNGELYADGVTFVAVPAGHTITSFIVLDATSDRVIAYIDRTSSGVPVSIDTADADIVVEWPTYIIRI